MSKTKKKSKKVLDPIECAVCKKVFTPADTRRRTCSRSCGGKLGNTSEARAKGRQTRLEKYGDENFNNREKVRRTIQEKYGEEYINSSQVPEIKAKIVKTYTERHGGMGMASESAAKKTLETTKKKYGIEDDDSITNIFQIEEVKDKIREVHEERWGGIGFASEELGQRSKDTFKELYGEDIYDSAYRTSRIVQAFQEKYGVRGPLAIPEVLGKVKKTNEELYGGMGGASSVIQDKLKNNLVQFRELYESNKYTLFEIQDIMGVSDWQIYDWSKKLGFETSRPNKLNEAWQHFIKKETGLEFKYEGNIYGDNIKKVDLYNEYLKIGIEINPTITHTTQPSVFHGKKVSVKYHQERAVLAEENGWHLIQVFDWDAPEDIIKLLKFIANIEQEIIYARKCTIETVSKKEVDRFTNENNRQSLIPNIGIVYGLYYKDELVQIMNFTKERSTKTVIKDSYNLSLYSKEETHIIDGASKLMEAFINSEHQPARIKAFVDYSKDRGKVYEQMGMEYVGLANLNAYYANIDTGEAYKVTTITNKYKDEYQALGKTQQEYMNEKRFYRINDAGNKIFEWNRK